MKYSKHFTDLALAASAVLGAGYLLATEEMPSTAELQERQANVFSAFSQNKLEGIRLTTKNSEVWLRKDKSSKDPHRYFLGKEGSRLADLSQVAEVLSAVEFATWKRTLAEDSALEESDLGFDSPRVELRLSAGPRSYRLLIGGAAPTPKDSSYARVEGASIETVTGVLGSNFVEKLIRGEQEFRGSALFPYSKSTTKHLLIEEAESKRSLSADESGFLLSEPSRPSERLVRADREVSDLIFYQLARASVSRFLDDENLKKAVLADPKRVTVTQESEKGPSYRSVLGGNCPEDPNSVLAIRTAPDEILGCVTRSVLPALRLTAEELKSQVAVPLRADEIDHLVIREGKRSIDLVRRDSIYILASHQSKKIKKSVGDELLKALSTGKLVPTSEESADTKRSELRIVGQGALSAEPPVPLPAGETRPSRVVELRLETYQGSSGLILHRLDDDSWFEVPSWLSWAFSADDTWARERQLFSEEKVTKAEVHFGSNYSELAGQPPAPGSATEEDDFDPDPALSRQLFEVLANLKVERFLPASEKPPAQHSIKIDWTRDAKDGAIDEELFIGERTRGGYLAWGSFSDRVLVLPLHVVRALRIPLGDRKNAKVSTFQIFELTLRAGDRTYEFRDRAGVLSPSGGEATDDMIAPLTEALRAVEVIARVGEQPKLQALKRGTARLSLSGKHGSGASARPFTLHIGAPTVFEDQQAFIGWMDGDPHNYLFTRRGLTALLELL